MSTAETLVRTKIARILSPTRVVLAAGLEEGVREGMEFVIYELSDPIFDPETKESLGQLELHKGRVRVLHVQERLATATTLNRKVYRPGFAEMSNLSILKGGWVEELEKLPIEQLNEVPLKSDLKVKTGDLVRSVS